MQRWITLAVAIGLAALACAAHAPVLDNGFVNYDDDLGWPSDSPHGPSIYLKPGQFSGDANDEGANWARSVDGVHGGWTCKKTEDYGGEDVGSPGKVPTE